MLVLYHDDFDGAASAAMLLRVMRDSLRMRDPIEFRPINHGHGIPWDDELLSIAEDRTLAIVDFPYHPAAAIWIDHHASALDPAIDRGWILDQNKMMLTEFNATSPSCAGLIYRTHLHTTEMSHLADAADMIDSAAYESAAQVYESTEPALQIDRAYWRMGAEEKSALIRALAYESLETVAAMPPIAQSAAEVLASSRAGLKDYHSLLSRRSKRVASINTVHADVPFLRYAPYHHMPELHYCVSLRKIDSTYALGVSVNAWNTPNDPIDLSTLVKPYYGGGHAAAAGCVFDKYTDAVEAFHKITDQLLEMRQS